VKPLTICVHNNPKCEKKLRRWYRQYNRRYFGGRLPEEMSLVEVCGSQIPRHDLGVFSRGGGWRHDLDKRGRKKKGSRIEIPGPAIFLRTDNRYECDVRLTLLHEMVHATGVYNHGPKFRKIVHRLMRAGAFDELV